MAAGGSGGTPNGQGGGAGTIGTNDASSTYGGVGGSSPFGQGGAIPPLNAANGNPGGLGAGGSGASAPDRTNPLNWTGGNGGDGYVKIYWGPSADPNWSTAKQYENYTAIVSGDLGALAPDESTVIGTAGQSVSSNQQNTVGGVLQSIVTSPIRLGPST